MKKLFLLTILLVVMYNSAISINPMKVAIYKPGAAANVQILINDYSGGSASLKYTGAIELLTPNASGIIVADIDGAGLSSIAAGDINPYYLIDVYVSGALYAQYRLDNLIVTQAQSSPLDGDGNLMPSSGGNGSIGSDDDRWDELFVNGNTIHIGPDGGEGSNTEMRLSYTTTPNLGKVNVDNNDVLEISKNGMTLKNTDAANTNSVYQINSNGLGSGISISLTNASNGSRGIDVIQAGVGPGVFATSAGGNGVWGITSSISAAGVIGDNTFGEAVVGRNRGGNGVGAVVGRNDSTGYGVRGFNTKGGIGVLGQAGISGGTGIAGKFENLNAGSTSEVVDVNSNGIGSGITVTLSNASNGGRGIDVNQAGVGPGVFATSAGGNGVWGITSSISAAGVIGDNTFGEAVVGRNRGGNGVGAVVGRNDSTGYGVRGFNTKGGIGVLGQAGISGGTGVAGRFENVNASNTSDALQVVTNSAGNAARFTGNVVVNGNLTVSGTVAKGGGSFKIDHPLDPENKILFHSFVESPDMKNIYDGNIILDANGEAWVDLPNWFQSLNRDFRYQLTAIGAPSPNLYIAQEVTNNRFKIAGGIAGGKVSWTITGIRHDPYANKHRIQVEVEKSVEEKGKYIHPECFGVEPLKITNSTENYGLSSQSNQLNNIRIESISNTESNLNVIPFSQQSIQTPKQINNNNQK